MESDRRTARLVGGLFIVATVTAVLSTLFVPSLGAAEDLRTFSASWSRVMVGVFLELIMVASVFSIPVLLFPILREHHENIARGYLVVRVFEAVFLVLCVVGLVLLLTLNSSETSRPSLLPREETR